MRAIATRRPNHLLEEDASVMLTGHLFPDISHRFQFRNHTYLHLRGPAILALSVTSEETRLKSRELGEQVCFLYGFQNHEVTGALFRG